MISSTGRQVSRTRRVLLTFTLASFVMLAFGRAGASSDFFQTKDGLSLYLGVLPAAMIQGHPIGHPEKAMHGGIPRGRDAYHVMAAVFDAASGARIENAKVVARVSPIGLAGTTRTLEPMRIADTITYGDFFTLRPNEAYRILITVARDGETQPVTMEFSHEHRTR